MEKLYKVSDSEGLIESNLTYEEAYGLYGREPGVSIEEMK